MFQFIKVQDVSTAEQLRNMNFTELPKEGSFFVFLNNGITNFSEEEKKKIVYTNKLCI